MNMFDLAKQVVSISEDGLKRRARQGANGLIPDETHFLNSLHNSLKTKMTPADELISQFDSSWGGDLNAIYEDYSY